MLVSHNGVWALKRLNKLGFILMCVWTIQICQRSYFNYENGMEFFLDRLWGGEKFFDHNDYVIPKDGKSSLGSFCIKGN